MKRWVGTILGFLCIVWCFLGTAFAGSIVGSKHNLSVSGPGTIRAQDETEVCIFCHAPHNTSSDAPLWNRYESGQTYIPYTSSTAKASVGQPTGASKLCLSCHDGTVALGMVRSRSTDITFAGGISVLPEGETNLGLDLSDDHPVSFYYDSSLVSQNPELEDPSVLTGAVKIDNNGQLQCTSCHDPHNNEYGNFLVVEGINSRLCITCHSKGGWPGCLHYLSGETWNGILPDPWSSTDWNSVAENGCENCHRPHSAGGRERLLNYASEEQNCFSCHNGNVADYDISAEFNKVSGHPVGDSVGLHTPDEPARIDPPGHIECVDCHNPHAASDQDSSDLPGSLRLIKGVNAAGVEINPINYEYELCFRCHADTNSGSAYVDRQYAELNTRLEFNPSNASYHPIENAGRNPDVPSLISPYNSSSIIKCTGCHNNNNGPDNSGTGPNGPHGSAYSPLLERQLLFSDGLTESYDIYALCYKCHDRDSILNNQSFRYHSLHITGMGHHMGGMMMNKGTSCTTCHDPHGVKDSAHLINFDRNIVSANSNGDLAFEDLGRYSSRCYLKCHNKNHN